jgi:hypothetical protein
VEACDRGLRDAGRDRSCPPPTSGFRCHADRKRVVANSHEACDKLHVRLFLDGKARCSVLRQDWRTATWGNRCPYRSGRERHRRSPQLRPRPLTGSTPAVITYRHAWHATLVRVAAPEGASPCQPAPTARWAALSSQSCLPCWSAGVAEIRPAPPLRCHHRDHGGADHHHDPATGRQGACLA